jgi:hypothetical protein
LPDTDLLVRSTFINTGDAVEGSYAGLPAPAAIREMQTGREIIGIYAHLLMAETGLLSLLAHVVPDDKFDSFKVVKPEYLNVFFAALPRINRLKDYENMQNPFTWVDNEADRTLSQQIYKNMIGALRILEIVAGNSMSSGET